MKGRDWLVARNIPVVGGDLVNDMEIPETVLPVCHLGGTHPPDLLEQYIDCCDVLQHAMDVLNENSPNARDYPPSAFADALSQHGYRLKLLLVILEQLTEITNRIAGIE